MGDVLDKASEDWHIHWPVRSPGCTKSVSGVFLPFIRMAG